MAHIYMTKESSLQHLQVVGFYISRLYAIIFFLSIKQLKRILVQLKLINLKINVSDSYWIVSFSSKWRNRQNMKQVILLPYKLIKLWVIVIWFFYYMFFVNSFIILISHMFIIAEVTLLLTILLGILNMLQVFWCRWEMFHYASLLYNSCRYDFSLMKFLTFFLRKNCMFG